MLILQQNAASWVVYAIVCHKFLNLALGICMRLLWAVAFLILGTSTTVYAADVALGKKIFQKTCTVCHFSNDQRKVGPGLQGVYGRDAVSGIGTLTEERLHQWLKNPRSVKPKTRMPTYKIMADPINRQAMIDFLQTL